MNGYRKRKQRTRLPRRIVVIVCEGLETERIYFDGFNERFSRVHVKPIHSGGTDARSIVKYAIEQKDNFNLSIEEGDELWCVFDVDDKEENEIKDMIEHGRSNGVEIALSNPSFELWYLLHFIYRESGINRFEVERMLKDQYIPDYTKNRDYNGTLFLLTDEAIGNAERLNVFQENMGINLDSKMSNPSSQVFRLVRAIKELKERNRDLS